MLKSSHYSQAINPQPSFNGSASVNENFHSGPINLASGTSLNFIDIRLSLASVSPSVSSHSHPNLSQKLLGNLEVLERSVGAPSSVFKPIRVPLWLARDSQQNWRFDLEDNAELTDPICVAKPEGALLSVAIATSLGCLTLTVDTKGSIELHAIPPGISVVLQIPGQLVCQAAEARFETLNVVAHSFINRSTSLMVERLSLSCTEQVVNASGASMQVNRFAMAVQGLFSNEKNARCVITQASGIQKSRVWDNAGEFLVDQDVWIESSQLVNRGICKVNGVCISLLNAFLNQAGSVFKAQYLMLQSVYVWHFDMHRGFQGNVVKLINHGQLEAENIRLNTTKAYSTKTSFLNGKKGTIRGRHLDFFMELNSQNQGVIEGERVRLSSEANFQNAGRLFGAEQLLLTLRGDFFNRDQGELASGQSLGVSSKSFDNSALVKCGSVECQISDRLLNRSSGSIYATTGHFQLTTRTFLNAGEIKAFGDVDFRLLNQFHNRTSGSIRAENRCMIRGGSETLQRLEKNHRSGRSEQPIPRLMMQNEGLLQGTLGVLCEDPMKRIPPSFINSRSGRLVSDRVIELTIGSRSANHGLVQASSIMGKSAKSFQNSGEIKALDELTIHAKTKVENTGALVCKTSEDNPMDSGSSRLFIRCKQLRNSGKIVSKEGLLESFVSHLTDEVTFDNRKGVVQVQNSLRLRQSKIRNDQGVLTATDLMMQGVYLSNQHGWIQALRYASGVINQGINNSQGSFIQAQNTGAPLVSSTSFSPGSAKLAPISRLLEDYNQQMRAFSIDARNLSNEIWFVERRMSELEKSRNSLYRGYAGDPDFASELKRIGLEHKHALFEKNIVVAHQIFDRLESLIQIKRQRLQLYHATLERALRQLHFEKEALKQSFEAYLKNPIVRFNRLKGNRLDGMPAEYVSVQKAILENPVSSQEYADRARSGYVSRSVFIKDLERITPVERDPHALFQIRWGSEIQSFINRLYLSLFNESDRLPSRGVEAPKPSLSPLECLQALSQSMALDLHRDIHALESQTDEIMTWLTQKHTTGRLTLRAEIQLLVQRLQTALQGASNPLPTEYPVGVWLHLGGSIRCLSGSSLYSAQGQLCIRPISTPPSSRSPLNLWVDDSSRISGVSVYVVGFKQIQASTPLASQSLDLSAERIRLERGVWADRAKITQTQGWLRLYSDWRGGHFTLTSPVMSNWGRFNTRSDILLNARSSFGNYNVMKSGGKIEFTGNAFYNRQPYSKVYAKNLVLHGHKMVLLGTAHTSENMTLKVLGTYELGPNTQAQGALTVHLPDGLTFQQPYQAYGTLRYQLAATAKTPLVFLANQTALQGDFIVEAPVPVNVGDATRFVTIKAENGCFSIKAPSLDVEQGGIVARKGVIETPNGFTLGRLVGDPTRQVFGRVLGFLSKFYVNRVSHLFILPVATRNGSFLHLQGSLSILGAYHHRGALNARHLTIDSPNPSIWEASVAQVTGDCTLTGRFILKRTSITFSAIFNDCLFDRGIKQDNYKLLLCNSDPSSLTVEGKLLGNAVLEIESSVLHVREKSPSITVNSKDFVVPCFQQFVDWTLEIQRNELNRKKVIRLSGELGRVIETDWKLPGYSNIVSYLVRGANFTDAPTVFPAQVSYNSTVILSSAQQMEGMCAAPMMLIPLGKGRLALGSPNPYYIPFKSPVRDLLKTGFNIHTTHIATDLKTELTDNPEERFHFVARELFWFNEAKAQAFYREIAGHLFIISVEGVVKQADPRAILSLSPQLLVERVRAEVQDVLMRGYIEAGEPIDESLVQRLHRNMTDYLRRTQPEVVQALLSGRGSLGDAPTQPLIFYKSALNDQGLEVLSPHVYFPLSLINAVRTQRGGLIKTNLLLAFPENLTPQQLTTLTHNNPILQQQLVEFFESHPTEKQLLEHQAEASAIEHQTSARALEMASAPHALSAPEQALAVPQEWGGLTIAGNYAVDTLAVVAEGNVTLIAADIKAQDALIASLYGNVELKAVVEREYSGRMENFDDKLRRARVVVERILQILSGKDVVLEAVHTQSGLSTYIEALGNILDKPVELVRQRVEHFYGRKCHGTITDTTIAQCSSVHQTDGEFTAVAGGSAIFYAPQIDAENVNLLSQGTTAVVSTTQRHDHSEVMVHKKPGVTGSRTKHSQSVSSQVVSTPAQLKVRNRLTIAGNNVQVGYLISQARENVFAAPQGTVKFTQGVHQSYSASQTQSRDLVWQSSRSEMTRALRYLASQIPGSIEVHAREIVLEQVRGTTLAFWERVQHNNATVTYQVLEEHYEHHSHSVQGPSQGLAIVVSLAAGIATFGAGTAFASGTLGIAAGAMNTVVAAGFSALCSQAAVALLQNQGNPFKAVESLASKETAKSLAMSMISAGIMHKIGEALNLPGLGEKKSLLQHAQYNIARASVNAALNMSIQHQSFSEAFGAALTDAAIGTAAGAMAQKMGGLKSEGHVSNAGHKVLHAALGAVVGTALNGSRGAIAGAMGAVIAETTAEALEPDAEAAAMEITSKEQYEVYQDQRLQAVEWGKFAAASIALLAGQDVPTAVGTATYAVENNFLTSDKLKTLPDNRSVEESEEYDEPDSNEAERPYGEPELGSDAALAKSLESLRFTLQDTGPRDGWQRAANNSGGFASPRIGASQSSQDRTVTPLWARSRNSPFAYTTPANRQITIKISTDTLSGHVYMNAPIIDKETKQIRRANLGFYPADPSIKAVVGTRGKLVIEKPDAGKSSKHLLTKTLYITEDQYKALAKNLRAESNKPGLYHLLGLNGDNCLTFIDRQLKKIGIENGLRDQFDSRQYAKLEFALIKLQANQLFREYRLSEKEKLLMNCAGGELSDFHHCERMVQQFFAAPQAQRGDAPNRRVSVESR